MGAATYGKLPLTEAEPVTNRAIFFEWEGNGKGKDMMMSSGFAYHAGLSSVRAKDTKGRHTKQVISVNTLLSLGTPRAPQD